MINLMNELPENSVAILASTDVKEINSGFNYTVVQDSNMYYLTGIEVKIKNLPGAKLYRSNKESKQ